jgi:hypothetical protein
MRYGSLLIATLGIAACSASEPTITVVEPINPVPTITVERQVYIDKDFDPANASYIEEAIHTYNVALNGNIKLLVVNRAYAMETTPLLSPSAIVLLSVDSMCGFIPVSWQLQDEASLNAVPIAWTVGNKMWFVLDRIRSEEELLGTVLHELGHVLGAKDHPGDSGIMGWAQCNIRVGTCVDKVTMQDVANYWHFPMSSVVYCTNDMSVMPLMCSSLPL